MLGGLQIILGRIGIRCLLSVLPNLGELSFYPKIIAIPVAHAGTPLAAFFSDVIAGEGEGNVRWWVLVVEILQSMWMKCELWFYTADHIVVWRGETCTDSNEEKTDEEGSDEENRRLLGDGVR